MPDDDDTGPTALFQTIYPQDYHLQHILNGIRTDGRHFEDFRSVTLTPTDLSTCLRSFIVKWGQQTLLMGGLRAEVSLCNPNYPKGGAISKL